jgi:hypothetical protein
MTSLDAKKGFASTRREQVGQGRSLLMRQEPEAVDEIGEPAGQSRLAYLPAVVEVR